MTSQRCLPGLLPLFAAALLGLVSVTTVGCDSLTPDGEDKADDEKAKKAYLEEAAQTYYEGGKYESAAAEWKKVLTIEPEYQKAKWGLAQSLAKIGTPASLRQSEQIFQDLVGQDFQHPTRGDIKFEVQKDFADVYLELADYYDRDIRALDEQMLTPNADVKILSDRKQTQIAARRDLLAKAIPLYTAVLEKSKDNPYAIAGLAKAHLQVGDDDTGIDFAHRYIDISRGSQAGWQKQMDDLAALNRGEMNAEQKNFFKTKIRGARDKELKMHLLLGSVLVRHKLWEAAINEYDAVVSLDPAYPAAYVERAQAYAGIKNYRKAVEDLQDYLKITDPVRHREARISAGELLGQYRQLAYGRTKDAPSQDPVASPDGAARPR